ncbi:arrestin-C-like [Rhinoraja longicauda]
MSLGYGKKPENSKATHGMTGRMSKYHMNYTCDVFHKEPRDVTVHITNNTSKVVEKIKITIDQVTDVVLYQLDKCTKTVAVEEPGDTVAANSNFTKLYSLAPSLANNRKKRGLALDGKHKHEDTNWAQAPCT